MNTFKADLKIGKAIEYEICELIKKKYPRAFVVEGYEKGYDIVVPEIKIEVKYDIESYKTGNYVIETESNNKPSGLSTTTAEIWVIVDKKLIIWINTEALKNFIKDFKEVSFTAKGDTKSKKVYLIPKDKLQYSPWVSIQKRT